MFDICLGIWYRYSVGVIEDMGFSSLEAFQAAMHNCNRVAAGLPVIGPSDNTHVRPDSKDWEYYDDTLQSVAKDSST